MGKLYFDITPQGPYFSIIRSAIWQTPLDTSGWEGEIDWDSIIQNYDYQSILPLVSPVFVEYNAVIGLPKEKINYLLDCVADNIRKRYKLREVYRQVFDLLESNGLRPILIKGEELAARYPQPNLRAVGDIDFYLGEHVSEGIRLLTESGAILQSDDDHHASLKYEDIEVELHYRFGANNGNYRFLDSIDGYERYEKILVDDVLKNWESDTVVDLGDVDQLNVRPLSSSVNAFYVYSHLVKHLLNSGVGIRQFIDLAILFHFDRSSISPKCLLELIYQFKPRDLYPLVSSFLVNYLGLPPMESPGYDKDYKVYSKNYNILIKEIVLSNICVSRKLPYPNTEYGFIRDIYNYLFSSSTFQRKFVPRYYWMVRTKFFMSCMSNIPKYVLSHFINNIEKYAR